eukprot:531415-Prymnesium_polylepis.1
MEACLVSWRDAAGRVGRRASPYAVHASAGVFSGVTGHVAFGVSEGLDRQQRSAGIVSGVSGRGDSGLVSPLLPLLFSRYPYTCAD